MTKDQIYNRCVKISNELSPSAHEAYSLARECLSARFLWRQDCDNFENKCNYGNAATQLENFCMANKQIRSEAEAALRKISRLFQEDARDPATRAEFKNREKEIKCEIEALKNAKNKKNGRDRKFFKIMKIIMTVSILLGIAVFVANLFLFDMTLAMLASDCLVAFVVSLVIIIVKSSNNKKKISALESELLNLEKSEKWSEEQRLWDAIRARDCYELIIRGTCGSSLADFR